ncbi:hypothetical protein DTO164E3_9089 [Paecilomyces variotii]|nr:hypothetical protein DTO164E3_9089 [Paecilomyces variotii]KAJ9192803.1 hypothetical protein DTO032I3_8145 [Paecilomyces variotii]KAJ9274838.1 hypothetical protein DTO021D3_8273 [Paecilomyces variotii]KAJ9287425.1 hypothetical protein DTO021C3_4909 [Paecilomyces variotii]KAJ9300531.1 hypothetical protein DTO217A2_7841 [Paecilomyces variotii]
MSSSTTTPERPWHEAFPAPRSTAVSITREEVLRWFQEGKKPGKEFVLVDLRRVDHEGGTIRNSINLPAQSLYPSLSTFYTLLESAGVQSVVWYCGSSRGRGTRAGGWFADLLVEKGNTSMKSLVLEGGIKGWVGAGPEYVEWMDGVFGWGIFELNGN